MFLFSISYTYRTCEQLRFCKDNMNTTHDVLSIKPGTQKFIDNEFIASLYVNNKESAFNLHIYKIYNSGFRIRIDPGTKLSSYRFNISHDNLIVDENKITNKEEITYETHRLFDVLKANKNTSALINFDPFFISISRDGRNYISINSENFIFIEDGSETPNTEYDGYNETYPHGKTAVGIDISFLSPNARLTGFSEGTYPANLVDTNYSSERHYSRDNYAMYGFVPMLSGHCPDFDIVPTVFWMNPTDMFIQINTKASGRIAKFVSEGGFIDLVVFSNKMEENLQEYSEITGLPPLAPAFAFGYHQSKYGYRSQQEVEGILSKLDEIQFPYDSIWLDIDHLENFAPFTINYTWFPDPQKFFDDRKKQNRFVIRITDPHLPTNLTHPVYKQGFDNDYFVKNSSNKQAIAPCWPGDSSWPDFFRKDVRNWWSSQFTNWPANVYVWNDMNEIAVFQRIEGTNHKDWLHLNGKIESREIHSSYGLFMTSGTFNGLTNRRPFVLTRSFFAGSQKFSWHWSGDNDASWEHLRLSLDMLISSNLNGLPFTGSDVGGFTGNVTDELHARWFQVGAAVYPFFRQHCAINVNYREPYLYNDNEIFDGMLESTKLRYKMFPLYYTNAYKSSKSLKPLVTPLWYTFNEIDHDVNYQLLIDEKVMVCPIVFPNTTTTKLTKPPGIWYELETGEILNSSTIENDVNEHAKMFLRGGTITTVFVNSKETIYDQMKENIELLVAVDENEYAKGDLYLDDGISVNYKDRKEFNFVTFEYLNGKINIHVNNSLKSLTNKINSIKFYGVKDKKSILISGKKEINQNIIKIEKLNYDITVNGVIGKKDVNVGLIALYVIIGISAACIVGIILFVFLRKRFGDDRSEKIGYDNIP